MSEDACGNVTQQPSIPLKQDSKCLLVSLGNVSQKNFISVLCPKTWLRNSYGDTLTYFFWLQDALEAGCHQITHVCLDRELHAGLLARPYRPFPNCR